MIRTRIFTNVINMPRSREVVLKLVERARHHPVSKIKSLLHPVTMMDINVNIENSLESLQQL